ncbi:MAG: OmpA family protein [Endomicrobia bacterium]|nr:OmpA family protein [Endomicrobiia bacterium]
MRYFYVFVSFLFLFAASGCSFFKPKPSEDERVSIRDIVKEQGYKITVYFDVNSDELSLISKDSIMRTAKLSAVSDTEAYLTGFADKTGIKENNVILSEKRVNAVKNLLISLGISEEHIYLDYFGDDLPVDDGETPEAYAKNRRVELLLTSKIEEAAAVNSGASKATIAALSVVQQRKSASEASDQPLEITAKQSEEEVLNENQIETQEQL